MIVRWLTAALTDIEQITTRSNLTGLWNGQFSYPNQYVPEFFVATLLETPAWLSGSIHEIRKNGRLAGQTLYATLIGTRTES